VLARRRDSADDDPTIIRHLHDLAALTAHVAQSPQFAMLVARATAADTGRGGGVAPSDAAERFAAMLATLQTDKRWAADHARYVAEVSYAAPYEQIDFAQALAACRRLVDGTG